MKVALAHDFLIKWGGAEKVLFDLHKIFPEAPIYTLFYDKKFIQDRFPNAKINTSGLQRKYNLFKRCYRWLLPWMPLATESMDFSDYDLVVSSSSAFLKGIIVPVKTKHICYMHTPTRWAWQDRPLAVSLKNAEPNAEQRRKLSVNQRGYQHRSAIKKILMAVSGISFMNLVKRLYIHLYRLWDFEAAQRPDILIANSKYTAQRIEKYYRREARVVYPGVERISNSPTCAKASAGKQFLNSKFKILNSNYFIVVSRLSAYKKIDLIIEAFKDLPLNLVIVGDGTELQKFKIQNSKLKIKERVFFIGFIGDKKVIAKLVENSIALIHLTEEDFGISMAEAIALGKPVIGLEKGGAKEIIKKGLNGELIGGRNDEEIIDNLKNVARKLALNKEKYIINTTKGNSERFSEKKFVKAIGNLTKKTKINF